MAFPTTAVLDNFNAGASQNLTARAGWGTSPFLTTQTTYASDSTPTQAEILVTTGGNNWGTLTWSDMEAFVTLTTFTPASNSLTICARIQVFGASPTYYGVQLAASGVTDLQIVKLVAGTPTGIGTLQSQTFTNGDSVGIDVIGTQIRSYYKIGAGAWTLKDTVTDSSITGAGAIGFRNHFIITTRVDNFGGGSLDASGAPARDTHIPIPFTQGAGGGALGGGGPH